MRITIGKQVGIACAMLVILFCGLLVYTFSQLKVIQEGYNGLLRRSVPLVFEVKDINTELRTQSSVVRAFVLTNDPVYAKDYQASKGRMEKAIQSLETKLITPEGKQKVGDLKAALSGYDKVAAGAIAVRKAKGLPEATQMIAAGTAQSSAAQEQLEAFVGFLTERMDMRVSDNEKLIKQTEYILYGVALLVILIAALGGWWFARRLSRPLVKISAVAGEIASGNLAVEKVIYQGNDELADLVASFDTMKQNLRNVIQEVAKASEQVAASSEQLSASADQSARATAQVAETISDVANGAAGQTQVVDQTAATVQDMTTAINHVAENSNEVSAKSGETAQAAQSGKAAVDQAVGQMQRIKGSVSNAATVVQKLGENSRRIGEIVNVITEIAGQTNLLALNAAIEAARAGEMGKGFAVVAEEVRKLAEQSHTAAGEISVIVLDIQNDTTVAVNAMEQGTQDVTEGSQVIEETGSRFRHIAEMVTGLNTQIQEISAAAQELAASSDMVAGSVANVRKIASNTAGSTQTISAAAEEQTATMQEIASSSNALSQMAEELRQVVAAFKL